MPRVFRVMKKDVDGLPIVSATGLGVRSGIDVDLDPEGYVLVNCKGMSVAPNWRDINVERLPKRLRAIVPGARGSNNTSCFRSGSGAFGRGVFAKGLILEPDSATHGNVAPVLSVPFDSYTADLAATRPDWEKDEA